MSFKKSNKVNRNYWKAEEERIIQQWIDKAQCYQWTILSVVKYIKAKTHGSLFQLLLFPLLLELPILPKIVFQMILSNM